jgi:hypothetical protein
MKHSIIILATLAKLNTFSAIAEQVTVQSCEGVCYCVAVDGIPSCGDRNNGPVMGWSSPAVAALPPCPVSRECDITVLPSGTETMVIKP